VPQPRSAVEQLVLAHDPHSNGERAVTRRQAQSLIGAGHYRLSTGSPHSAVHYRRSLPDGSCLHLVIEGNRRRLHHDRFDPHAGLVSLAMHVAHEARFEAASYLAVAWSVVRLLAR